MVEEQKSHSKSEENASVKDPRKEDSVVYIG